LEIKIQVDWKYGSPFAFSFVGFQLDCVEISLLTSLEPSVGASAILFVCGVNDEVRDCNCGDSMNLEKKKNHINDSPPI
jgi:hypothetical protein